MKRNVTISLPPDTYRRARIWAARHDTNVTQVVRYLIESLPGLPIARKGFPLPGESPDSASAPPVSTAPSEQPETPPC